MSVNDSFQLEECSPCLLNCPVMGYSAEPGQTGAYNLPTGDTFPYCLE